VIVCHPDPSQTSEVPGDDLDFFLLDIVSNGSHGLAVFDIGIASLGECLNCRVPHFTERQAARFREAAANALAEYPGAFQEQGRDVAETLRQGRARTSLEARIALVVTGDGRESCSRPY
jgi:hypothetical protein